MSAYVVSKKHIDLLVAVAVRGTRDGIVPPSKHDPDKLGQLLVSENVASVSYRYPDDDASKGELPGPCEAYYTTPYRWEDPKYTPTAAEVYAAIRNYDYQSCEHPGWKGSEAFRLCEQVNRIIEAKVPEAKQFGTGAHLRAVWPEMESAPWGWDEVSIAFAYAKNDPEGLPFLWALRADRTDVTTLKAFSDWLMERELIAEALEASDLPYDFPALPEPSESFRESRKAKTRAKVRTAQQTRGVHVRTWTGSGMVTVTDMTNAGKRGKKCRTLTFSGWVNGGDRNTPQGRVSDFTTSLVYWAKDRLDTARDFDTVAAEFRLRFAAGIAELNGDFYGCQLTESEVRGIDAPKVELTAGREGEWSAKADGSGVHLHRLNDVNMWAEITHNQTDAEAYRLAAKVWADVEAAETFNEASAILSAAGCRLHGFCMMD